MTQYEGKFGTHETAWEATLNSHFCGDDSIIRGDFVEEYKRGATAVGMKATGNAVLKGEQGVNFLARYYSPDVFYGNGASMTDPLRAIRKWTLTRAFPVGTDPRTKLVEKAMSTAVTDANTPVIGPWARKVLERNKIEDVKPSKLDPGWWSQFGPEVQFDNTYGDWMEDWFQTQISDTTGEEKSYFDTSLFHAWLDSAGTLTQLLSPPQCIEGPTSDVSFPADTIVNGEHFQKTEVETKKATRKARKTQKKEGKYPKKETKKNPNGKQDPEIKTVVKTSVGEPTRVATISKQKKQRSVYKRKTGSKTQKKTDLSRWRPKTSTEAVRKDKPKTHASGVRVSGSV